MKGDRWCTLRQEAKPKAARFAKVSYRVDRERDAAIAGYMRGYFAGATREERKGTAAALKTACCDSGTCSQCYMGNVTHWSKDPYVPYARCDCPTCQIRNLAYEIQVAIEDWIATSYHDPAAHQVDVQ